MDDVTIRFVSSLRERAVAVEKQLARLGFWFEVTEAEGIREWWLDESTQGGEPEIVLAKAQELDPELIDMADVIHEYDPNYYETEIQEE